MKANRILILVSLLAAATAGAKEPKPPVDRRPPPLPLLAPLDTDENGELSAEEIAAASSALAGLDQDGDGALSRKEILPPPPRKGDATGEDEGAPPPPPKGPGGEKGKGKGKPLGPIVGALDADKDGTISADEITNAPEALLALDKDDDGAISPKELKPRKPPGKKSGK